ncbi:MAG: tetratricopeptide repeat protein [bacterium]|nr:tetratricopeptide repeat protein [bacterium]
MRSRKNRNAARKKRPLLSSDDSLSRGNWRRRALFATAVACLLVAGVFLGRGLWVSQKKAKSREAPRVPAWSDPPPNAQPQEAAQHYKAEGLAVAKQLMSDFPGKADPILLMGQVHYGHGNTEEAISYWEKGLKLDPKRADAYDGMGWIALRKGDFATAVSHWQKALELDPRMPGAHSSLARSLMGLGKVEEAVEAARKDLEVSPQSVMSHFLLGEAYFQLEKYGRAKEAYENAIALDPACTNAYYNLARSLMRLNESSRAKEYTKKFQELKAEDMKVLKDRNTAFDDMVAVRGLLAKTHADAGQIYRNYGKLRVAEAHWKRAAALEPRSISPREHLASLYQSTGNLDDAIRMHEELADLDPQNAMRHLVLASSYSRVNRYSEAEAALGRAMELDPQRSWAYRDLAQLCLRMKKDFPRAKLLAEKAVELEPSALNYNILGWALFANGETEASLAATRRAVELDPQNPEYQRRYRYLQSQQTR